MKRPHLKHETLTALKFAAVGCLGFLTQALREDPRAEALCGPAGF